MTKFWGFTLLALLVISLAGCASNPYPSPQQTIQSSPAPVPTRTSASSKVASAASPSPQTASLPLDAAQIYARNCANCHGANRTGGSGPSVTQASLANRSEANLAIFISAHQTGRNLSSAEITALSNWLKTNP